MKSILCFGDSNTRGAVPVTDLSNILRHPLHQRWPGVLQHSLGPDYLVIPEGLGGRTTCFDDPIDGAHKNGLSYLLPALESHMPLDWVVIMLGTNDLKSRFGLQPVDIAAGAERLALIALDPRFGPDGRAPSLLLVCPPHIREEGVFAPQFAGGAVKSEAMAVHYAAAAMRANCHFLDAGTQVGMSAADGIHMDPAAHASLGATVAQFIGSVEVNSRTD